MASLQTQPLLCFGLDGYWLFCLCLRCALSACSPSTFSFSMHAAAPSMLNFQFYLCVSWFVRRMEHIIPTNWMCSPLFHLNIDSHLHCCAPCASIPYAESLLTPHATTTHARNWTFEFGCQREMSYIVLSDGWSNFEWSRCIFERHESPKLGNVLRWANATFHWRHPIHTSAVEAPNPYRSRDIQYSSQFCGNGPRRRNNGNSMPVNAFTVNGDPSYSMIDEKMT